MASEKQTYSKWFYIAITAGTFGAFGGLYYLYSLLKDEPELNDKDKTKIEEIKDHIDVTNLGELTPETSVKILSMINKKTEEQLKSSYPDLETKRREAIMRPQEYKNLCTETIQLKHQINMSVTEKILNKFGYSMEKFDQCLRSFSVSELDKRLVQLDTPYFIEKPTKEDSKKAFIWYGNKSLEQMNHFQKLMNDSGQNPYLQQFIMEELMIMKFTLDDNLFRDFKISESHLKYLLYNYNLNEDSDVKKLIEKMAQFEER